MAAQDWRKRFIQNQRRVETRKRAYYP